MYEDSTSLKVSKLKMARAGDTEPGLQCSLGAVPESGKGHNLPAVLLFSSLPSQVGASGRDAVTVTRASRFSQGLALLAAELCDQL